MRRFEAGTSKIQCIMASGPGYVQETLVQLYSRVFNSMWKLTCTNQIQSKLIHFTDSETTDMLMKLYINITCGKTPRYATWGKTINMHSHHLWILITNSSTQFLVFTMLNKQPHYHTPALSNPGYWSLHLCFLSPSQVMKHQFVATAFQKLACHIGTQFTRGLTLSIGDETYTRCQT